MDTLLDIFKCQVSMHKCHLKFCVENSWRVVNSMVVTSMILGLISSESKVGTFFINKFLLTFLQAFLLPF